MVGPSDMKGNARSRRVFMRRLALVVTAVASARAVLAHAKLVRSIPRDKAALQETPRTIELWFNELLDNEFNSIEVFTMSEAAAKDRKNMAKKKAQVDGNDRTHLVLALEPLPPGNYLAEYRVLSRDSHTAPGRLSFSIAP